MKIPVGSVRLLIFFTLMGASLYSYIDRENALTQAKLALSPIAREVRELEEQNAAYKYALRRFEAPSHLFQIASEAPYGHLAPTGGSVLALRSETDIEKLPVEARGPSSTDPRIASSAVSPR